MDASVAVLVAVVVIVVVLALLVVTMLVRRGRRASADAGAVRASTASSAAGPQIAIQDFAFAPASITVPTGTTITWTNRDVAHHTVTFRNGMADSGELGQGQTFRHTFATPGSFDYWSEPLSPDQSQSHLIH